MLSRLLRSARSAPEPDFTAPALEMEALTKRYPDPVTRAPRAVLDRFSLTIRDPGLYAVVGPDGAGKSTLLDMVAGLLSPDEGHLTVFGLTPDADSHTFLKTVAYLPQQFALHEELSLWDNITLFGALKGLSPEGIVARARPLLEQTGLAGFERRRAGALSGGMKQKLSLVVALLQQPKLLILDEPTVGVDPVSRAELWAMIASRTREEAMACLVTTSLMTEAQKAQHVVVLQEGRTLLAGAPHTISKRVSERTYAVDRPREPLARRVFDHRLLQEATPQSASPLIDAVPRGDIFDVLLKKDVSPVSLNHVWPEVTLRKRPPTLEDAFLAATLDQGKAPLSATRPTANAFSTDVVIEVQDVTRRFGSFVAVSHSNFSLVRGEIFGLLGPNGAGKTTTFRMLCGLLNPSEGRIMMEGVNILTAKASVRQRIGYVAQKFSLYARMSAWENLRYFAQTYGLRGEALAQRLDELMQSFLLTPWAQVPAGLLPLGVKRQLAMAVGLVHSPSVLFLDEPTSGADTEARRAFWRRITALADQGTTVVVTTHFMEEAEYCDRILIQNHGRTLALGTPQEVRALAHQAPNMEEAFIRLVTDTETVRSEP